MAENVVEAVKDFLSFEDAKKTKKTLWDMYNSFMMSDAEISKEERRQYTLLCIRIGDFLSDILKVHKELSKEFKNLNDSPPS